MRTRGRDSRGGISRRLPSGLNKFGRNFNGLGDTLGVHHRDIGFVEHKLDVRVHFLTRLGKRNALARMEATHEPVTSSGPGNCNPMWVTWDGQQPGRARGPASTEEAHSKIGLGHNTVGVVHDGSKAVLLPDRASGKVDAWFRVHGLKSAAIGDNGAKFASISPGPLLPLMRVHDVDTLALSVESTGFTDGGGPRLMNSTIYCSNALNNERSVGVNLTHSPLHVRVNLTFGSSVPSEKIGNVIADIVSPVLESSILRRSEV